MSWQPPDWLIEIGKILFFLFSKAYEFITWSGSQIEKFAGPIGKYFFLVVFFIVVPFIVTAQFIAKTQSGMESFQASLAGFFLKLLAIAFVVFLISYVLSQM
jgi:hypothetical protein